VAVGGQDAYCLGMPFVDPDNPDRRLTVTEIRAMLDRGRAEAKAEQGTDLDLLLAKWDEDELPAQQTGKSSAA
jgi:hypothetical protein